MGDIVADFVDGTIPGPGRVIGGQKDSVVEFLQQRASATAPRAMNVRGSRSRAAC